MILCIGDVLDAAGLAELRATIAGGMFVEGVLSSGWASHLVKNNEQLGAAPTLEAAQQKVIAALASNPVFSTAVLPRRFELERRASSAAPTSARSFFDLERLSRSIFERDGKCEEYDLVNKSTANLKRMWVE